MGFFELFLIGIGLSMDAFAVAICKGLGMERINKRDTLLLALFFARLGDCAAEREVQRRKYIDRRHARPEEPEYRQNRRDA